MRTPGILRIVCLGDSFTEGVGVHAEDRLSEQLEKLLNRDTPCGGAVPQKCEVFNCGLGGYGTRDERALYQYVARNFRPHVVLLFMVHNDAVWVEESMRPVGDRLTESVFETEQQRQEAWSRLQPHQDYSRCIPELIRLRDLCAEDRAKLFVFSFRNGESEEWQRMSQVISAALAKIGVPFCDLGETLLRRHLSPELTVHPIDGHPNELAHRLAAEETKRFLCENGLLATP